MVWVNGCFDIIHIGHIKLLQYASSFGDLIVGLDSDRRIAENKGNLRPFNTLNDRIGVLESIKYVKRVVSFDTNDELIMAIKTHKCKMIVVGSDYIDQNIIGSDCVDTVKFFQRIPDKSTSIILQTSFLQ